MIIGLKLNRYTAKRGNGWHRAPKVIEEKTITGQPPVSADAGSVQSQIFGRDYRVNSWLAIFHDHQR